MENKMWGVQRSERPSEVYERVQPFHAPGSETRRKRIGLPGLAVLGLLCHTLFFSSPCGNGVPVPITGWTVIMEQPLFFATFPIVPYLACLLPILRSSERTQTWFK